MCTGPFLFVVSAKTEVALLDYIKVYIDFCGQCAETKFRDICYTSCVGREHYRCRFACVVKDMDQLISKLERRLGEGLVGSKTSSSRLAFAFPGQGSQFEGMAQHLSQSFPAFHIILKQHADLASALSKYPVLSLLLGSGEPQYDINHTCIAQIRKFVEMRCTHLGQPVRSYT